MTRKRKLAYAGGVLLILLIASELFCRYYLGLGDPPLSRADPELEYLFVGSRTYHRFGNTIEYNSFSMRTHPFDPRRKNPEEIRVMVCGDSVINGGALTDQAQLMTSRLEKHLVDDFHRPAVVMNVSAGSWGPPNYLAYIKRYGLFESNVLVIVVSSHDWADAPTWDPVVGVNPDFPDRTPTSALSEALFRYLPRYLPHWGGTPASSTPQISQGQIDQSMGAFRELIALAQKSHIPVIVAQHLEKAEIGQPESEGHKAFHDACLEGSVPSLELGPAFDADMKAGGSPYRDNIHPNTHGQELIEKVIFPAVSATLRK